MIATERMDTVIIIGHRGAAGYAPENTLASMDLAYRQGCDGIEFDVQLTKDREVVVIHDWTVDRTTSGTGEVKNLTLQEIKELDAGNWFSPEFKGETVPTLKEVFRHFPKDLLLNMEIKIQGYDHRPIEREVFRVIEDCKRRENTLVSSFNNLRIKKFMEISGGMDSAMMFEGYLAELPETEYDGKHIKSFHPSKDYIDKDLVAAAKKRGLAVYSWTVNDLKHATRLQAIGVDGIITNYPSYMIRHLK